MMKDLEIMDERIIKVADLLEQIKSVDEMIGLHRQKGDEEDIMLIQYQYRREQFLKELSSILEELNIKPADLEFVQNSINGLQTANFILNCVNPAFS